MLKIKTNEFINRIINRGMNQFHLSDLFDFCITEHSKIPANIKTLIKKSSATSFFEGGQSDKVKYIFMRLKKDKNINPEEARLKFVNFIKATILIDKNDPNIIDPSVAVFFAEGDQLTEDSKKQDVGVDDNEDGDGVDAESDNANSNVVDATESDEMEKSDDETNDSEENADDSSDRVLFLAVGIRFE